MSTDMILANWDNAIVDLNRNKGMFKATDVRLRNCSLHYSEHIHEYYIKHRDTAYGIFDIKNIRI